MEKNVLVWLEKTAERLPEKIAYDSETGRLTFHETLENARRIGAALSSRQLGSRPVAVMLEKDVQTIPAFLGVVYSGRAYAPLDASLPDARVQTILKTLMPAAVVTCAANQEKAACRSRFPCCLPRICWPKAMPERGRSRSGKA